MSKRNQETASPLEIHKCRRTHRKIKRARVREEELRGKEKYIGQVSAGGWGHHDRETLGFLL